MESHLQGHLVWPVMTLQAWGSLCLNTCGHGGPFMYSFTHSFTRCSSSDRLAWLRGQEATQTILKHLG